MAFTNINHWVLCILASIFCDIALAQNCGTITPNEFKYPLELFEELGKTNLRNDDKIYIPVSFHYVGDYNLKFVHALDLDKYQRQIDIVNLAFQESNLVFYLCESVNYARGRNVYNFKTGAELHEKHKILGTVNVYLADKILIDKYFDPIPGFASFPRITAKHETNMYSKIFLSKSARNNILIHELGHFFGLRHTHEIINGKELVDGSNCTSAGDLLCDTPADPNLSSKTYQCIYNGTKRDANGDLYHPDPSNYMSYSPSLCWNKFTPYQISVMNYYAREAFIFKQKCSTIPENINLFPNPVSTHLNISLTNGKRGKIQIRIRNLLGQLLQTAKSYKAEKELLLLIDIADLTTGLYLVELYYEDDNTSNTFKVFKK